MYNQSVPTWTPQPLYMEICAEGEEVAGARVNEQIIFMNDTIEVGGKDAEAT